MQVFTVPESTSGQYTATIVDETGAVLPAASLLTATLSLYDASDPTTIINSRDAQNILNTNDVTISAAGLLTWVFTPNDMPRLHTHLTTETHVALFTITWGASGQLTHTVRFKIIPVS